MTYIILGVYALTLAAGGFGKMMKESKINGVVAAILLTACIILNLVSPITVKGNVNVSLGGVLLILLAFITMFYKNKIGTQFYIFYISILLGIVFYLIQKVAVGVEITAPAKANILLYALFVLIIMLFSVNPKSAFSISVISINFSALMFYLQDKTPYVIGGGDTFQISAVLLVFSTLFSFYIQKTVLKLYPRAQNLMSEMSEKNLK